MSGLFNGLAEAGRTRPIKCSIALTAEQLDHEDRTAFLVVTRNTDVPAQAIRDRLATAGYDVTKDSIWRHRRGDCKCPREATT